MENGLIQTVGNLRGNLSTIEFKSISIDLSDALTKKENNTTYLSHVSTRLLIENKHKVATATKASKGSILLELHSRLHRPIFCLVAAVLAFSILLIGNYNRSGLGRQIAFAISIMVVIKIAESYSNKLSVQNFLLWPLIYLPSLIGIISSMFFLNISASRYRLTNRA